MKGPEIIKCFTIQTRERKKRMIYVQAVTPLMWAQSERIYQTSYQKAVHILNK